MYTIRMNQKYANDAMFFYYKVLDKNLAWFTQITEESKCNQKTLNQKTHTYTQTHIQ